MDARELIVAQIEKLNQEKQVLVNDILVNEQETIAAIRQSAADEAEAAYKREIEVKVAGQFSIAEQHLTSLLAALPEEKLEDEQTNDEQNEETLI